MQKNWFDDFSVDLLIETDDFFNTHDKEIYELELKCVEEAPVDVRIEALSIVIAKLFIYQRVCEDISEFHTARFNAYWVDSGVLKKKIDKLEYLMENRDNIRALELRRNTALKGLQKSLLSYITNYPGILQKDLYKAFDSSIKGDIQNLLYLWSKSKKIKRVLSGNTYALFPSD